MIRVAATDLNRGPGFPGIGKPGRANAAAIHGFTLLELGIVMVIVAVLTLLSLSAVGSLRTSANQAKSISNLRQLGLATQLYVGEHDFQFFNYQTSTASGTNWWYGFETTASLSSGEGNRTVDKTESPLYPYLNQVGGVEICPGFDYATAKWKAKYQGATYGYGYNVLLCSAPDAADRATNGWSNGIPYRLQNLSSPTQVVLFATCAQVNTFQGGASSKNPKIEEFPGFDSKEYVIHGRFNGRALALYVDGHCEAILLDSKKLDSRMPSAKIGRFPATMAYK